MKTIHSTLKTEIIPIILVLVSVVSSFYFYAHFPEQVPVHWNYAGEPDNWASKEFGAFLFPAIILGLYLMLLFLPNIDPRKEKYEQFNKTYHAFKLILVFFFVFIYLISSLNGLGMNIPMDFWTPLLVGSLFIMMGNYFGKIKRNWFLGIKTPWTLSSEDVWNKTHRVGGRVFVLCGFLIALTVFLPAAYRVYLLLTSIFVMIFGLMTYSYLLYRKEKK